MAAAEAQPISPELVLVSQELREHALELLPAIDPDALFEPRHVVPDVGAPSLHAVPEPEPERLRVPAPEHELRLEPDWERPRLAPIDCGPPPLRLPLAVAAYATEALLLGAVRAAGLTAAIAILAFLLAR